MFSQESIQGMHWQTLVPWNTLTIILYSCQAFCSLFANMSVISTNICPRLMKTHPTKCSRYLAKWLLLDPSRPSVTIKKIEIYRLWSKGNCRTEKSVGKTKRTLIKSYFACFISILFTNLKTIHGFLFYLIIQIVQNQNECGEMFTYCSYFRRYSLFLHLIKKQDLVHQRLWDHCLYYIKTLPNF